MRCPACTREIDGDAESCPACGAEQGDSYAKTRILPEDPKPRRPSRPGRRTTSPSRAPTIHSTSDSLARSRFVAGTILNERYRVVGLLGRGGMGEVYRAEVLTLGQTVALKFLPESLSSDGAALARFHREVRVARQISHRNVCRVYDIGEAEGMQFLSMECVRGEELSSVLKRFGRLPADKATEIARQLCAGLAAAHDAGVLHRDLKPSNVMIDENGDVRVTDFGLAGLVEEFGEGAALEGTPEYMSPEQLAGRELTARSDIYSLGLVLYELYTGRKAFTASTLAELLRLRKSVSMPDSPSTIVRDVDPLMGGRLLAFEGVPPQTVSPQEQAAPAARFDWARLFAEAGLDPAAFRAAEPVWLSPQPFDERAAWEGTYPGQPDTPVRVEAAAFRGRLVYYQLINPWNERTRQAQRPLPAGVRLLQALIVVLFFVILCGAALLARHNLRLGRGDRRGALRLAGLVLVTTMGSWLVGAHHVRARR